MTTFEQVREVLASTLQLGDSVKTFTPETGLLDEIPEFDSMAVVNVVAGLEEHFDIVIDDEELTAEHFATLGSLTVFVDDKLTANAA
ncbi:acyl carrier protein [Rhodovibrio salinarum]|uniref:Acyl carrier protein n=1 Tax=Rhodovibrio salinarum TaxID=1087 RepID=A0A934QFX1_9PROT|nr:acyl carrier protein [Rhodovibrio salinarum]MBK1696018.1 acyl carrier protein [Rhodovibrio salinarum]